MNATCTDSCTGQQATAAVHVDLLRGSGEAAADWQVGWPAVGAVRRLLQAPGQVKQTAQRRLPRVCPLASLPHAPPPAQLTEVEVEDVWVDGEPVDDDVRGWSQGAGLRAGALGGCLLAASLRPI